MQDLIDRLRTYASTRKGELAELITEAADALERQTCEDAVSRAVAIDALNKWESCHSWDGWCYQHKNEATKYHITAPSAVIETLPAAQPKEAISVAWLEEKAKWFESMDNAFSKIEANNIRVLIKQWREQRGSD